SLLVREIKIDDAENFIKLIKNIETQSDFMLMEPGERKTTFLQQRKHLKEIDQQNNSTIFVAEVEDELVGYLIAIGGRVKRTKQSAYIVICNIQSYRGKGIRTELFNNVNKWASKHNISRLELTAVTENKAGLTLYKKSGLEIP